MAKQATAQMATTEVAVLVADIDWKEREAAELERQLKELWQRYNEAMDAIVGAGEPARFLSPGERVDRDVMVSGRYVRHDGAGTDMDTLARTLSAILSEEEWAKCFVKETRTVIQPNAEHITALGSRNPEVAEAIKQCTSEGRPTLVRIKPTAASADDIAQAQHALDRERLSRTA